MSETNYDSRFEPQRFDPETALAIETLVDGELGEEQQRELLTALDHVDGGWRRLALAYVEAQCLSRDFGSLLERSKAPRPAHHGESAIAAGVPLLARPRVNSAWWKTALAMAASFLVALGLGALFRGTHVEPRTTPSGSSPVDVASQPLPPPTIAPHTVTPPVVVEHSSVPAATPKDRSLTALDSDRRGAAVPLIPVGGGDSFDAVDHATGIPPQVVEALKRLGHRVEQRRGVLPVRLPDGRTAVMPVDQVDVEYRGPAAFQ